MCIKKVEKEIKLDKIRRSAPWCEMECVPLNSVPGQEKCAKCVVTQLCVRDDVPAKKKGAGRGAVTKGGRGKGWAAGKRSTRLPIDERRKDAAGHYGI